MNPALKDLTDADLKRELEDRATARKNEAIEKNKKWLERLPHFLTMDVVDMLAPVHKELSDPHAPPNCSDDSPWQGFGTRNVGGPVGCNRCGLIEMMKGNASENVMNNLIELELTINVLAP